MAQMPANVRISAQFPFPSTVQGSAPITLTKLNGVFTVGFNISGLGIQTPLPASYATDYVIVWDSIGNTFFRMPLSGFVPLNGLVETVPVVVNFNAGNTDTQIAVALPPGYTRYRVIDVTICNASQTLTTSTWGLFSAAAAGGLTYVGAGSANTVSSTADSTANNSQFVNAGATNAISTVVGFPNVFFRVGTAQGAAATGQVIVRVQPLP